jgi:hypothetical protein
MFAFFSTVTADGGNQGGYALRTEFEAGPASGVPVPAAVWTGMALLAAGAILRRVRGRLA